MKCDNIKKLIHLNGKDELSDSERNKLEEHLSACESCRDTLESLESKDKLILHF